jgi:hypothetical protein
MTVVISAVASEMGMHRKNGTTIRKVSASPGPELEIIDSIANGPPVQ